MNVSGVSVKNKVAAKRAAVSKGVVNRVAAKRAVNRAYDKTWFF